jgi:hypothetical protein
MHRDRVGRLGTRHPVHRAAAGGVVTRASSRPLRVLSVTTDHTAGLALLRGAGSRQLAVDLGLTPQWSESGRGWAVDAAAVPDLIALGEHLHYCVSWRERAA